LEQITDWRETLAKNIALRNKELSVEELNEAVQRILDRLLFIRNLEDREIEPENTLLDKTKAHADIYKSIIPIFRNLDNVYNGLLFKKHFSEDLIVDDKALKDIIKNMCYPVSPFQFDVIEPEILGRIYEKFLGSKIRLTESHQAKVEEKMEVRKAGGVYYTPEYIVDYIVKNTVGKKIEGLTPEEIKKIKIVDPACGSGSFLLGAYSFILDYHARWYSENKKDKAYKNDYYINKDGELKVNLEKRGDILRNNIFGVDIDKEATEVAIMSLYLKMLDDGFDKGERDLFFIKGHVLPDMTGNVKCGNSLIGTDYFSDALIPDDVNLKRINPFDWNREFLDTMCSGGFDCVIGNPPYIRIQTMKEWAPIEVEIYKELYTSAQTGNYDIYVVFAEKALSLLKSKGTMGFILPHKFFNAQYGAPLRGLVSKGKHLRHVVHFGDAQIFSNATTYTCLLFLDKDAQDECNVFHVSNLDDWNIKGTKIDGKVPSVKITESEWNFTVGEGSDLLDKLSGMPVKLGDVAKKIAQGIRTSANEVYVLDMIAEKEDLITAYSKQLDKEITIEKKAVSLFLQGREIKSYRINSSKKIVIIPYRKNQKKTELISEIEIKEKFPHAYSYLNNNKLYLENREHGKMKGKNWYAFVYPKNIEVMTSKKILVPDIADRASFAFDRNGEYSFTSGYGIILRETMHESYEYILGLLNSSILNYFLKNISTTMRGGFFRYFSQYIEQLPIRAIDFNNPSDKEKHDKMVSLVEKILELHKKKAVAKDHESELIERLIVSIDAEINQLVYDLYDLTDEEIKIVEG
ncbi:MAG: Eco57I restriction-modification methylase domain-containing protein, partial [Spirochaetes bacterium]|nr:Eco57I restriction-modification methylase domain-containing protein [Spirochaetota bacterium]